jgi:hypothetical protein
MTKTEKLNKLTKEAPNEIPKFLKAAKLMKNMNGISISGDDATLKEIKEILSFKPSTKEGEELKTNILKESTEKSRNGMFDGVFFIS